MKKVFILCFLCVCLVEVNSQSQLKVSEHSIRVHGGTNNFWLGLFGTGIMAATIPYLEDEDESDHNWIRYMPTYDWIISIPQNTVPSNFPQMENRSNYFCAPWDGLGDAFVGLEYRYYNHLSPVFFTIDLDYKNQGVKIESNKHVSHIVAPGAKVGIKFGDFTKSVLPLIEIGGGYNYAFSYSGPDGYEKKAINSGAFVNASIGISIPEMHSIVTLQYERNLYNFFNDNYSLTDGTKPFNGYERNNSYIMLKLSHSWY